MRTLISLLLCLLPLPALAESLTLHIRQQAIQAEVAATQAERERGLMQRKRLCGDCGMLFVFPGEDHLVFWMKDTPLPLSVAFIAANGSIINIEEMQPNSTTIHRARGNALYALEMNRGWFARHGIRPSNKIDGLQRAPRGQ